MSELTQTTSRAEMYEEGSLLTPHLTDMYSDVLQDTVDGAAHDIRDRLAVIGLSYFKYERPIVAINYLIEASIDKSAPAQDSVAKTSKGNIEHSALYKKRQIYAAFMLRQAGGDLALALENLYNANEVVAGREHAQYANVIDGSYEDAFESMKEANDPRETVALNLLSLGLGDELHYIYDHNGNYFNDQAGTTIAETKTKQGAYEAIPTVPFLVRSEEAALLLPQSVRDQFKADDLLDGYAVLHGNVLYKFQHSLWIDEEDDEHRLYPVSAYVMTPEGVEAIEVMIQDSRQYS